MADHRYASTLGSKMTDENEAHPRTCQWCGEVANRGALFCRNPKCSSFRPEKELNPVAQMIPAIVLPEPKPFYGIEHCVWVKMTIEQRHEAQVTYFLSVDALKSIYAQLLAPLAVVK